MVHDTIQGQAERIETCARQTKKIVSRILLILTLGLPLLCSIPFLAFVVIPSRAPGIYGPPNHGLVSAIYAVNTTGVVDKGGGVVVFGTLLAIAVIGLVLSIYFTSLLNRPQYSTFHIEVHPKETLKPIWHRYVRLYVFLGVFFGIVVYYGYVTSNSVMQGMPFGTLNLIGVIFLASWLVCFLLGYKVWLEKSKVTTEVGATDSCVSGEGLLPNKIRVGESHNISVNFGYSRCSRGCRYEAELKAVGAKKDCEAQELCESSPVRGTTWNCTFDKVGNQTVNLVLNKIRPDSVREVIFRHPHDINVEGRFVASLQPAVAVIVSALSAVATFIAIVYPK